MRQSHGSNIMTTPNCTTHHYACDCREAMFAEMVDTSIIAEYAITQYLCDDCKINREGVVSALKKLRTLITRATGQGEMK